MTRALLKKQLLEVFAWLYKSKKTGKRRSRQAIIGFAALYLLLFAVLALVFWFVGDKMCATFVGLDLGWLYWCTMALIAIFMGVFGSVFNTYSSLYQAKDNDLLLSMPIPVSRILLMRLSGVYAIGLMYELIVMLPAQIVWLCTVPFTLVGTINVILIPILLSGLILVLSAILGWVVALISAKLKNKSVLTVLVSLVFFGGYYYFSSQASNLLQSFVQNAEGLSGTMQAAFYPLYHMGLAAEGNALSMLIFTAIIVLLLVLTYFVLSRSFLKLATANPGTVKKVYKEGMVKPRSVSGALLFKEWKRFSSSSAYMLNCGLGVLGLPIAAILLFWKADIFQPMLEAEIIQPFVPLAGVAILWFLLSMVSITAPSVSLEGKTLWLLQSLPVSGAQVIKAKLSLQLMLVLPLLVLPIVAEEVVLQLAFPYSVLVPVAAVLFAVLFAALGLAFDLRMPNFQWTSETTPIKQGASGLWVTFGSWIIIAVVGVVFYFVADIISIPMFFLLLCLILAAVCAFILHWLFTKGARLFETL